MPNIDRNVLMVDGILSTRVRHNDAMIYRQVFTIFEDHVDNCYLCRPDDFYWRGVRERQEDDMDEFEVEWDPTIRF